MPAAEVKTQVIAQLSSDCTEAECTENEKSKFKHPDIQSMPILETYRITKRLDPSFENSEVVNTSYVQVTFPSKVLPDYVELYGLLIPLKLYTRAVTIFQSF